MPFLFNEQNMNHVFGCFLNLLCSWVARMSTVEMSKTSSLGARGESVTELFGPFKELPLLWAALNRPAAVLEVEVCGSVVVVVGREERCPLELPFPQGVLLRSRWTPNP